MSNFVPVLSLDELPEGTTKECAAEGRVIALYRVGDEVHALDGVCPHAGGPLGQGRLEGCIVTCPWHGWQFDVTSGQHCLNENLQHTSFPTRVVDGQIEVGLP